MGQVCLGPKSHQVSLLVSLFFGKKRMKDMSQLTHQDMGDSPVA